MDFLLLSTSFWVEICIFNLSMNNQKISIRFFNDREVRAVWDVENAKWWFSVLDIVAVLTDQDDYNKTRN
jgi:cell filamentation protein